MMEIPNINAEIKKPERAAEKPKKYFFVRTVKLSPLAMNFYPADNAEEAAEKLRKEFHLYKKDLKNKKNRKGEVVDEGVIVDEITKEQFKTEMARLYAIRMENIKKDEGKIFRRIKE